MRRIKLIELIKLIISVPFILIKFIGWVLWKLFNTLAAIMFNITIMLLKVIISIIWFIVYIPYWLYRWSHNIKSYGYTGYTNLFKDFGDIFEGFKDIDGLFILPLPKWDDFKTGRNKIIGDPYIKQGGNKNIGYMNVKNAKKYGNRR